MTIARWRRQPGTLWVGGMSWSSTGGVFVARKQPGQNSFDPPVMTIVDPNIDKGWMAAGPDPANPLKTRLYVTYNMGIQFSTDMGVTWSTVKPLDSGIGFLPRVGKGGEVYVCYWNFLDGVMLMRSLDGGQNFDPPIRIATRKDSWGTSDGSRFPGNFRVPPLNALAVDSITGDLYCVYFDTTGISGTNRNVDLYFTSSTDQGTTWTVPRVINQDAVPPGDQFFPWLEVDSRGILHLSFFDSRNTAQNDDVLHGMFDLYYAVSVDHGRSWSEYRLTPASFDSYDAGGGSQFIGDYNGLGVGGNKIYPCYLSTQNGDPDVFTNLIEFVPVDFVVGAGAGSSNPAHVRLFDANAIPTPTDFYAYGATGFGVHVASAQTVGNLPGEILTGPGPGPQYGPHVRGFDRLGNPIPKLSLFAYGTLRYGVNIAGGDLDGDGIDEILTGAGSGPPFGPHVRGFNHDGNPVAPLPKLSYFAYATLRYGVNVEEGHLDTDGYSEILTGPGPGPMFAASVRGFDYDSKAPRAIAALSFNAFATSYGVAIAGGDVDADGTAEIAASGGPGPLNQPRFRGFDFAGGSVAPLPGFDVTLGLSSMYGGRLDLAPLDPTGNDLIAGQGPDPAADSSTFAYSYENGTLKARPGTPFLPLTGTYGVNVAGGVLGF